MTSSDIVLATYYDCLLVALSVIIAVLASYAALDLAGDAAAFPGVVCSSAPTE